VKSSQKDSVVSFITNFMDRRHSCKMYSVVSNDQQFALVMEPVLLQLTAQDTHR